MRPKSVSQVIRAFWRSGVGRRPPPCWSACTRKQFAFTGYYVLYLLDVLYGHLVYSDWGCLRAGSSFCRVMPVHASDWAENNLVVHHRFCVRNIIHHRDKIHWHLSIILLRYWYRDVSARECSAVHVHEAVHRPAFITHRYRFVVSLDCSSSRPYSDLKFIAK